MDFSIPDELSSLGITNEDFEKKKFSLAKSLNTEVNENEVIWELYKDLLKKAHNFEILQIIYWNMAVFKDKIGQNSFKYQQKSQQSRLLNLRHQGKTKVKINSKGCSPSCRKFHNLVFPISKALTNLPIPNSKCVSTLNSHNSLCKSIYMVANDNELVSKKIPPKSLDTPEFREIINIFKENTKGSYKFSKKRNKNINWKFFVNWAIPLGTFFSGLLIFFYSPFISLALSFWGIFFCPPLIKIWVRIFPFFKKKLGRYIIFCTGLTMIIFSILISLLPFRSINHFQQKSAIPEYQIISIKDNSINSRSRLYVSIESQNVKSARERALLVMEVAKKIYENEFFNEYNNLKYDYIFVSLELKNINFDQNYVLAEAEFAPDGGGFEGLLIKNDYKWKWNVRSSNFRIKENNPNSIQKIKGTLKTFLLR